jgi:hypothetical protein
MSPFSDLDPGDADMSNEIAAQNVPSPALGPRGRPKKACTGESPTRFSGSYGSKSYWLARFDRDFPEIALLVRGGRMTANAAAIKLGLRTRAAQRKPWSSKLDIVAGMIG